MIRRSCHFFSHFVVFFRNILKKLRMFEILGVDEIDFPDHAQVFNGKRIDLFLFQLIHAGAFRKDGDTEIPADQVLDGRDVVDLKDDVKIIYTEVLAFQRCVQVHHFLCRFSHTSGACTSYPISLKSAAKIEGIPQQKKCYIVSQLVSLNRK